MHYLHIRRQLHAHSALYAPGSYADTARMDRNQQLGAALAQFRAAAGLKQVDVADRMQVDQTTISRIERGRQGVDQDTLARLAEIYGVRVSEIFEAVETDLKVRDSGAATYRPRAESGTTLVPLIGWVQAGTFTESDEPLAPEDVKEWVPTHARVSTRAYALQIEGESMVNPRGAPSFPPGTRIVVDPKATATSGDFVVAQIDDEPAATFKKLTQDGGRMYLTPLNPQFPALLIDKTVIILGVVRTIAEHAFRN